LKNKKLLSVLVVGATALVAGMTFVGCDFKNEKSSVTQTALSKEEAFSMLQFADWKIRYNIDGTLDNLKIERFISSDITGDTNKAVEYYYYSDSVGRMYLSEDLTVGDPGKIFVFEYEDDFYKHNSWQSSGVNVQEGFYTALNSGKEEDFVKVDQFLEDDILSIEEEGEYVKIYLYIHSSSDKICAEYILDKEGRLSEYNQYIEDKSNDMISYFNFKYYYGGVEEEDVKDLKNLRRNMIDKL